MTALSRRFLKLPRDEQPRRIFASLMPVSLGDFISNLMVAATIRKYLEASQLLAYYRVDREYKDPLCRYCPYLDYRVRAAPDYGGFPIDLVNPYHGHAAYRHAQWAAFDGRKTDIILGPGELREWALAGFEEAAHLAIPEAEAEILSDALEAAGVDRGHWFACVYWREPGYLDRRPHRHRDVTNPSYYHAVMRHVLDDLGGQVVRLGHPGMSQLPDDLASRAVDLSARPDSFPLQAYAVSRARFMVGSSSGPVSLGSAFFTPTLATENLSASGVWNRHDRILTRDLVLKGGQRIGGVEAIRRDYLPLRLPMEEPIVATVANNADQIIAGVESLLAGSGQMSAAWEASGWREPYQPQVTDQVQRLAFPLAVGHRSGHVCLEHFQPKWTPDWQFENA